MMEDNWESKHVKKARNFCRHIKITIDVFKRDLHNKSGIALVEDQITIREMEENLRRWSKALPEDEQ